ILLTVPAAAELLAVSPDTVREWARRGRIPGVKIGRVWRFVGDQLCSHVAAAAERNVRCRFTVGPTLRTGGSDSRSAVAGFESLAAPQIAPRRREAALQADC